VASQYGEYSVISYIHPLRGERVNLGVAVWHPLQGSELKLVSNPSRVRCVDEAADVGRIRNGLEDIRNTLANWKDNEASPLEDLHVRYKHGLVVTSPTTAVIQDKTWVLDRLTSVLLPPAPFMRASSTRQFGRAFARQLQDYIKQVKGLTKAEFDFLENDAFQPVRIAARFSQGKTDVLWRAASFATLAEGESQVTAAKALYAENSDIRELPKYREAALNLAVQLPKPTERATWNDAMRWLQRDVDRVEVFEDRGSLEQKVPELVSA